MCIILFGAGWTDLLSGKVRNLWLLAGALPGLILTGRTFLCDALLLLVPSYLLFRMRMMGAGDGKMMALIAGYLGIDAGLRAIGIGMAIGAVWSLYRLWHEKTFLIRFTYLTAYIRRVIHSRQITEYDSLSGDKCGHTVPLAVCLMAGTYVYLLISGVFLIGKEIY